MSLYLLNNAVLLSPFVRYQLIKSLVKKELTGRYTGSFLGFLWAILNPLSFVIIYYFVCSMVFKLKIEGRDYNFFEFLICGLWSWIAFSESVNRSCVTVVEQAYLVKKVFFPSEVLVPVVVVSSMVQQTAGFGVFLLYLVIFKFNVLISYWWHLLFIPFPFLLQMLFSMGIGWIVSCVNVFWRDLSHIVGLFLNIWFYATPVIYPYDLLPDFLKKLTLFNPAFGMVSFYRWIFLNEGHFLSPAIIFYCVFAGALYLLGSFLFGKLKEDFSSFL